MVPTSATIKVRRELVEPQTPPKAAHKFLFTRVGVDIVLEVGFFDLLQLREAVEARNSQAEPPEVILHVTDRFTLSPQGLQDLSAIVKQLVEDMPNYVQEPAVSWPKEGA